MAPRPPNRALHLKGAGAGSGYASVHDTREAPTQTGFLLCVWFDGAMATVGRKSKGDRHLIASRVPRAIADQAFAEAGERGMSMSDFVAAVLAERYERTDLVSMAEPTDRDRLPLTG